MDLGCPLLMGSFVRRLRRCAATLLANTPSRMSDHEAEISSSVSVTSGEVAREIRAVTDPLTQQLAHL